MYHSVKEEPHGYWNSLGPIIHSTAQFRSHMELIARQYDPITLDNLRGFLQGEQNLPRRPVVITFDDGYADNLEVAAPIMNRWGIPGTFYVTVGCIDQRRPPWVSRLRYAFFSSQRKEWSDDSGRQWSLMDNSKREAAFLNACEQCARKTGEVQEHFVRSIEVFLEAGIIPEENNIMLSWNQARQLLQLGHSVGSHTLTHPNVAHIDQEQILVELRDSKQRLQAELGQPVPHFSYPCPILQPHWSRQTVAVCRQVGYQTAVTTNAGPVRAGDDLFTLHRVPAPPDADDLGWNLDCTFLGRAM
jgi:peptidoglycan/xylan/chitin deacetylase (PgdA/CDA1 family)